MKVLLCLYFFLGISIAFSEEDDSKPVYITSLNEDSNPDDNITEVTNLYAVEFKCEIPKISDDPITNSVHKLGPANVDIVGAMGDSMTAALFAKVTGFFGLLPGFIDKHSLEYRGVSWSIGGDDRVTTLPNFIKSYNPNLQGYSVKTGKEGESNAAYNFAVSGAVASDLLGQAELLVKRIKDDGNDDKWKVITIFIGGNDLCAICKEKETYSAENFYIHVQEAIVKLSELSKLFINLVQTVEVSQVSKLTSNFGCAVLQGIMDLFGKCSCITDNGIAEFHASYMAKINELEKYFREKNDRDDFVVVVQPFFGITTIPKVNPQSYFAPDCFHLSQKGLTQAAVALWNNMLQPVGSKTDEFLVDQNILCPDGERRYFFTHKNSGGSLSTNNNLDSTNKQTDYPLSTGQIVGVTIGTILLVAAGVGAIVGGVIGYYLKNRRPRFSQYTSLSKQARV